MKNNDSNQLYMEAIFNATPHIVIVTNGNTIENANSVALDFFGFETVTEFREEHNCICDYFVEKEGFIGRKVKGKEWINYILENRNIQHNVYIQKENKNYRFVIKAARLEVDNENRSIVTLSDVTEIEELNEYLELAVYGSNDGLWDWNIKEETVYFSPRWKEMLGYRDDELENSFEAWESRVHPEDLAYAHEMINKAHTKPNVEYRIIHRLRHKDGHWVWILVRGQTIFDKDNKPVRMVGFHTDITKQKELELELTNTQNMFEMFANQIPFVVVIKDAKGRVIFENKKSKAYRMHVSIGHNAKENLGEALGAKIKKLEDKARLSGMAKAILEYKKDDKTYLFQAINFLIPRKDERIFIGAIYIDITNESELSKEIESQQEIMIAQSRHAAMGEMISMIAHQWRQPISVIAMDANNILVDVELEILETESLRKVSTDIINQTQELSKTIDDFKDYFKPNRAIESIFVKDILNNALGVIGKSLQNNNIEILFERKEPVAIKTFSREVMQVFINILKNAEEVLIEKEIKDKKIFINIQKEDEIIIILFKDNAGGIDVSIIEKIFDPYFTTKGEKNGTGLGLYMSKSIIEKHLRGEIKAFNIDEGACFEIRLPLDLEKVGGGDS